MFYVGHFFFEDPAPRIRTDPRETGWFTLLVEATSIDEAIEKLRELIDSLGAWFAPFQDIDTIYLAEVTEVRKLPPSGVLAHYHAYPGSQFSHTAASLPGVPREFCVSYDWGSSGELDVEEEMKPFVDFERPWRE